MKNLENEFNMIRVAYIDMIDDEKQEAGILHTVPFSELNNFKFSNNSCKHKPLLIADLYMSVK